MANNVDIGCGDNGIEFVSEASVVFKNQKYGSSGYNIKANMKSDGIYILLGCSAISGNFPTLNMTVYYNNDIHFSYSFGYNNTDTFATIHGISYGNQTGASYSSYYNAGCYYDIFIYQNGTIISLIDGWTDTNLTIRGLQNCALIQLGGA